MCCICERFDTECSGTGTWKTSCPEQEIHMRLKEKPRGLEEVSRKVSRCVCDGFFGNLRFK